MGVSLVGHSCDRARNQSATRAQHSDNVALKRHAVDPDPKRFSITRLRRVGNFLIVMINYPNCTTYGGDKLLVYEDMTVAELNKMREIDPHFLESKKSPVARFVPTQHGWNMAVAMFGSYE
jgi:hypothetical protein